MRGCSLCLAHTAADALRMPLQGMSASEQQRLRPVDASSSCVGGNERAHKNYWARSVFSISRRICSTRPLIALASPLPPMIVVLSLSTTIRFARPNCSIVTFSSLSPRSSEMGCPPVSTAISCSMALRRSPKPGALTAKLWKVPRTD